MPFLSSVGSETTTVAVGEQFLCIFYEHFYFFLTSSVLFLIQSGSCCWVRLSHSFLSMIRSMHTDPFLAVCGALPRTGILKRRLITTACLWDSRVNHALWFTTPVTHPALCIPGPAAQSLNNPGWAARSAGTPRRTAPPAHPCADPEVPARRYPALPELSWERRVGRGWREEEAPGAAAQWERRCFQSSRFLSPPPGRAGGNAAPGGQSAAPSPPPRQHLRGGGCRWAAAPLGWQAGRARGRPFESERKRKEREESGEVVSRREPEPWAPPGGRGPPPRCCSRCCWPPRPRSGYERRRWVSAGGAGGRLGGVPVTAARSSSCAGAAWSRPG